MEKETCSIEDQLRKYHPSAVIRSIRGSYVHVGSVSGDFSESFIEECTALCTKLLELADPRQLSSRYQSVKRSNIDLEPSALWFLAASSFVTRYLKDQQPDLREKISKVIEEALEVTMNKLNEEERTNIRFMGKDFVEEIGQIKVTDGQQLSAIAFCPLPQFGRVWLETAKRVIDEDRLANFNLY